MRLQNFKPYLLSLLVSSALISAIPNDAQANPQQEKFTLNTPNNTAKILHFSGYDWMVYAYTGAPGPNYWSAANAWVDSNGYLHLKISQKNGRWYCAQVGMTQRLGFGKYQFQVIGAIDKFDPNIVLGLFNYPTADVGMDGTNEIDIEIAQWGQAQNLRGSYTAWPVDPKISKQSYEYPVLLNGTYTTQRFTWTSQQIYFQSLHGHQNGNLYPYATWRYKPSNYQQHIAQQPMPVYMNLWLNRGEAPTNGKAVEVIISSFKFTPAK